MANSIALIQKYSPEILDELFVKGSCTAILERNLNLLKFVNANTVLIPDMVLEGLGDYNRATGFPDGDVTLAWTPHTLRKDRGKSFHIDSMDDEETAGLAFGELAKQFMRVHVIPEVDAYRLSMLAALAASGNKATETIAANTIISKFNGAIQKLADNEVPLEDCVLFISTAVDALIKSTTELNRIISQIDFTNSSGVTFKLRAYENIPIIVVPPTRFKTTYDFGDEGFTPTEDAYAKTEDEALVTGKTYYTLANGKYTAVEEPNVANIANYYEKTSSAAKDINFMLVSLGSALPVKKHEKIRVFAPDTNQSADAWKFQYRLYHDIFTPKNKVNGIYVSHKA